VATSGVAFLILSAAVACAEDGDAAERTSAQSSVAERALPADETATPPTNTAWVIFGADTVVAEVARTAEERADGLMYREELPEGTGMLFVFEDVQTRSFWMANTYIPLDIAYMDVSYVVVDIKQMEPLDMNSSPSAAPAMFALEVPQGWFADHGVVVGDQATVEFGVLMRS